jgi:hypothetical protein
MDSAAISSAHQRQVLVVISFSPPGLSLLGWISGLLTTYPLVRASGNSVRFTRRFFEKKGRFR